jgi:probable blue pigment (indigoidine) exporter
MNIVLAMLAAFLWGTTYAVTQYSLAGWPPLLLGALRALPAGLLLFAIKPNKPKRRDWAMLLRLGGINIALFFSLLFVMAQTLPSAISGVGMISVPVFAMLFHWIFNKKSPSRIQVFSGALLILCAWLLFDPRQLELSTIGMLAMLTAISCIVLGSNIIKALTNRVHWWTILCWQLILGGLLLAIVSIFQALVSPAQYITVWNNLSLLNGLGLIWLIILNTALAYSLYVWLLGRMTVVEFTFAGISNPIAGVIMGLLLLNESFSVYQYSLMACMLLASLLPPLLGRYFNKRTILQSPSKVSQTKYSLKS